jgi:NAD(P)-dependent dehydrogenase (short-subunit alcohol dehydrogenase family)
LELQGKKILISGATSGIGKEVALMASRKGAQLILLARDLSKLKETKQNLDHSEIHTEISLDLFEQNFEDKLKMTLDEFGGVDGFVHAAGVSLTLPLKLIKEKDVQDCFRLNVFSALFITQLLMQKSHRSSGLFSAVYISSVLSEVGEKGKSLYSMSKSALLGMCKSLALEFASKGARFNCVSPSVVETPLSQKSYYRQNPEDLKTIMDKHPLGFGMPEDVANAVVFLLSDSSKWITGSNMIVDGGYLAR